MCIYFVKLNLALIDESYFPVLSIADTDFGAFEKRSQDILFWWHSRINENTCTDKVHDRNSSKHLLAK